MLFLLPFGKILSSCSYLLQYFIFFYRIADINIFFHPLSLSTDLFKNVLLHQSAYVF